MVIRRNTKKFREIASLVNKFAKDLNRKRRIKLYSLKAGSDISEKTDISRNDVIYNLYYQMLLEFLKSDYTLHASEDEAGLFYFVSGGIMYLPFRINKSLFKLS